MVESDVVARVVLAGSDPAMGCRQGLAAADDTPLDLSVTEINADVLILTDVR